MTCAAMFPPFQPVECAMLLALSLVLPISIFFGRGNIRQRRLALLQDLEHKIFKHARDQTGSSLPYLDVVRARYECSACGRQEGHGRLAATLRGYGSEIAAYL